jgi:hypothetical protein
MGRALGIAAGRLKRKRKMIPLIVEALVVALAGFLAGLLLAYLLALHRRANVEWRF